MNKIYTTLQQHISTILQIAFGLICVFLGIYFIKHESADIYKVKDAIVNASSIWLITGLILTIAFVVVQGMMYQQSFAAIKSKIGLWTGITLFLKRNLISVFLPAGLLTNMMFFNKAVEKRESVTKTQIYFASSIFSFCSILSAIIIGIPALIWLFFMGNLNAQMVIGIALTLILIVALIWAVISIKRKGKVYTFLEKKMPSTTQLLEEFRSQALVRTKFYTVIALSVLIELIGISHLYISVKALGGEPSISMAIIGYAIVLLLLMSSPFLRGIGAIEAALTYALTLFGLSAVMALSVAFLFRFFEFWAVLILGLFAVVIQRDNIVVRLIPSVLIFFLGLTNVLSALTPALPNRLRSLSGFLPLEAINASNWLVLISGIIMLIIAIYLFKGLKNAWKLALVLSSISLLAHIGKGIDWEEASFALITILALIYQRKQYIVNRDKTIVKTTIYPALIAIASVMVFGTISFYYLNPIHFNADFTFWDSIKETLSSFLLLNINLEPATPFGKQFLISMHLMGTLSMTFLLFLILKPFVQKRTENKEEELLLAKQLMAEYGRSSLDYFKMYSDKKFWFNEDKSSFVSYKVAKNYAITLENPTTCTENLSSSILEFDNWCAKQGLRSAYYRVSDIDIEAYRQLGKKVFPIGEEATLNLTTWTIAGSHNSGIRNSINKLTKNGFQFCVSEAPQKDAFIQQLKAVSDGWLNDMKRTELVFSQGVFDAKELKNQTIFSFQNQEGKVFGFLNMIPDNIPGEANFDLMRKTEDAPNGTMDFLFAKMFEYLKEKGFLACNLGMVPMSGIDDPENIQEHVIKIAYEKLKSFSHYKSLRSFKEKFNPDWQMMYLVYNLPYDLIHIPNALSEIIKP